jgi:hypothetical protein
VDYISPVMLRPGLCGAAGERTGFPGMSRNINSTVGPNGYIAFKNVIRDGSGRRHVLVCRPEMSTLASAFAFISMSTSA